MGQGIQRLVPRHAEALVLRAISMAGTASISEIATKTGINRNTLKKQLSRLVSQGAIRLEGSGRGVRYRIDRGPR